MVALRYWRKRHLAAGLIWPCGYGHCGPHRTIHVVRAGHHVPTTASASWSEPSLVRDDEPESATLPAAGASRPYGAGWR